MNEQAGEAMHMRVLNEQTNQPMRKHGPAFGARSGVQNDRAIQEERTLTRNELDKLSQENATLTDSLYAKPEKSWSVSSLKKSTVSKSLAPARAAALH